MSSRASPLEIVTRPYFLQLFSFPNGAGEGEYNVPAEVGKCVYGTSQISEEQIEVLVGVVEGQGKRRGCN